jgi:hypothetical protein
MQDLMKRPHGVMGLSLLSLLLGALSLTGCDPKVAEAPESHAPAPVVWRLAPASEKEAHGRVATHLLALEALSGPLIEVAMRDEGRGLCQRWGEEVQRFLSFAEPDFVLGARLQPLKPADQRAIDDAYQRFGVVAARCLSGGGAARDALTRVKELVKPMLRAI